jgi:hypothetical protein
VVKVVGAILWRKVFNHLNDRVRESVDITLAITVLWRWVLPEPEPLILPDIMSSQPASAE